MALEQLRIEYSSQALLEKDASANPLTQFEQWFREAVEAEVPEPNALTLATATRDGRPSARIVLLKGFDERGFVFYSNSLSRKGRELGDNPNAAMVFLWKELERQVRIEGSVDQVSAGEADLYFAARPRGSQLGAWASAQSSVISDRTSLEQSERVMREQFGQGLVPRPSHWCGYRVRPLVIEFWQGRPSRLHDRLRYSSIADGEWQRERLAP